MRNQPFTTQNLRVPQHRNLNSWKKHVDMRLCATSKEPPQGFGSKSAAGSYGLYFGRIKILWPCCFVSLDTHNVSVLFEWFVQLPFDKKHVVCCVCVCSHVCWFSSDPGLVSTPGCLDEGGSGYLSGPHNHAHPRLTTPIPNSEPTLLEELVIQKGSMDGAKG